MSSIDQSTKTFRITIPSHEVEDLSPDELADLRLFAREEFQRGAEMVRARRENAANPQPCRRFPCDYAYRGEVHDVDEDGHVDHIVSRGGSDSEGWWVASYARDEGPWGVMMRLAGDEHWRAIQPPRLQHSGRDRTFLSIAQRDAVENAGHLANALVKAALTAASHNW